MLQSRNVHTLLQVSFDGNLAVSINILNTHILDPEIPHVGNHLRDTSKDITTNIYIVLRVLPGIVLSILSGIFDLIFKITLKGRSFYYPHFTDGKLRYKGVR